MVVMPECSRLRRWLVARQTRRANASRSTWSSHEVSLYGCRRTCVCVSIRPGSSVIFGSGITRASFGTLTLSMGPTASIVSPRTTHPPVGMRRDRDAIEDQLGLEHDGAGGGVGRVGLVPRRDARRRGRPLRRQAWEVADP